MSEACLICDVLYLEMVNIFLHPRRLNTILRLLLGLQTTPNNYLCTVCCDEIIKSFDSELNCQLQWNTHIPKVLKKEAKLDPDKAEITSDLSESKLKIEPKCENELESDFFEIKLRGKLEKVENIEYWPESFTTDEEKGPKRRKVNFKKEFKTETLDVDLSRNYGVSSENCLEFFKRETSVDLDDDNEGSHDFFTSSELQEQSIQEIGVRRKRNVQKCSKEKLFACTECEKAFTASSSLNRHKVIHTGERPHECRECGKCFAALSSLNRHKVIHTGERPYKCLDCGKCYTDSSGLTRHKGVHTGELHACSYCPKTFGSGYNFRVHLRSHTKEKPYVCSECGKSFARPSTLNRHKKTHSPKRPLDCS